MKKKDRGPEPHDGRTQDAMLQTKLRELLVDAAMSGQAVLGRGMLRVLCDAGTAGSITWEYKPIARCTEELDEWPALGGLLASYDTGAEVVIALVNDGASFLRLRVESS